MKRIKKILIFLFALKNLYKKDRRRQFSVGHKSKILFWMNGFLPESSIIYDFNKNSYSHYLSDLSRTTKASNINKENSIVIDNKLLFAINFINDKIVPPLFYINEKTVLDIKESKKIQIMDLIDSIRNFIEFVAKPVGGGGGFGIHFFKYIDSKWYINGNQKNEKDVVDLLSKLNKTLIYRRIKQTGIASRIHPDSLNTTRILTMIDPVSGKPFIASAVFRCGTSKTKGVDNWSSGGLSSNIDIESGIFSKAVGFPNRGKLEWVKVHPDTQHVIEGCKLPNWKTIKQEILSLSKKHFYIPYIGWDVISMENDFMILEANGNSDVNLLQVHEPLLKNSKARNFYKHYNVI